MSLLYAAYMAGALMIGVPIALHLLRRKPKQLQVFPSFMFLTRTAPERQQKNNIRKWLVLLARCLILLLLSIGFAWPFIPRFDERPETGTVLLWDNSFSMNASPYRSELIDRAQDRIDNTDMKHPMQVGLIGDRTEWSGEMDGDASRLRKFFDRRPPAEGASRFERAIRQADLKLQRSAADHRTIVLITDRQLAPWQDVRMSSTLRPGTKLEVISPDKAAFRNVAVQNARVDTRFTEADQALSLSVQVRNHQLEPADVTLETSIDGKVVDSKPLELAAVTSQTVTVTLPPLPLEPTTGTVKLVVNDELDTDNLAYFAVNPEMPPTVGMLTPKRDPNAMLFVELAMNPSADVSRVNILSLTEDSSLDDYQKCDLIVIADGPQLSSDAAQRLETTLLSGGNIVAVWRNTSSMRQWLRQWEIRATPANSRKSRRIGSIEFEHPIFAPFMDVRVGGLFEVIYYSPPNVVASPKARVLSRFDTGSPAVVEQNVGEGKLFFIGTEISRVATDWPTHSSFLPFWRELLAYASQRRKDEHHYLVSNRSLRLDGLTKISDAQGEPIKLPRERFTPRRAGGYFAQFDDDHRVALAVNVPPAESDPLAVGDSFSVAGLMSEEKPKTQTASTIALPEDQGKSFWWLVLAAAGSLMLVEVILANRTVL